MQGYTANTAKQRVALLAEGVDRNTNTAKKTKKINVSPSSRRAWIEISRSAGT